MLYGLLRKDGRLLSDNRKFDVDRYKMVRLVGLEPTTGKTPVDFKPTAYANFATAAPATRHPENITRGNYPHNLPPHSNESTTQPLSIVQHEYLRMFTPHSRSYLKILGGHS
jgi:hypothetical protein